MKNLIVKFLKLFKKQKKNDYEYNFIDTPMRIKTIEPPRRGQFKDNLNYYSQIKNY